MKGRIHNYRVDDPGKMAFERLAAPSSYFAITATGVQPTHALPDCTKCPLYAECWRNQVANYYCGEWQHPFALLDCEGALVNDEAEILRLFEASPMTAAQLAEKMNYTLAVARMRILNLRRRHILHIVDYIQTIYPVYGFGPEVVKPPSIAERILNVLHDGAELTAQQIAEALQGSRDDVTAILSQLERRGKVRKAGRAPSALNPNITVAIWAVRAEEELLHG